MDIFYTENTWLVLALVVLIALVYKPAKAAISNILNSYTEQAIARLQETWDLRDQAEADLESLKKELEKTEMRTEEMKRRAEEDAKLIIETAKEQAERVAKRRVEAYEKQISQMQNRITADVKKEIMEQLIAELSEELSTGLKTTDHKNIIESDIATAKKIIS